MKKLSQIPVPLQRQVLSRLGFGALAALMFAILLYMTREIYSTLPCIALAAFCVASAWHLYRRALRMDYILLRGECGAVELTSLRKLTKSIVLNTDEHVVRVMMKQRRKRIPIGAIVDLYIANTATVEDNGDALVLYQYLALDVKGGRPDNAGKGTGSDAG